MATKREEQRDRLVVWSEDLSEEQVKDLLIELVMDAIDSEMVCFWPDSLAPYWEPTGDPLIEGQKCFR